MAPTVVKERKRRAEAVLRRWKLVVALAFAFALTAALATNGVAAGAITWTTRTAPPVFGPAVSMGGGKLVIFGTDAAGNGIVPYTYSPSANTWTAGATTNWIGAGDYLQGGEAATLAQNGTIVVLGGVDENNEQLKRVAAYNPTTNTWKRLTPMLEARDFAAAVTGPAGKIYAIGGDQGGSSGGEGEITLQSVEAYSLTTNKWIEISPLNDPRYAEAAAVGSNGQIYVFGGCQQGSENQGDCSDANTAEVLNPSSASNPWKLMNMPASFNFGSAGLGGTKNGLIYLNGVGAYNPATNKWTSFTPSPINPYDLVGVGGSCGYVYGISATDPVQMDRAATVSGKGC